jgi:aminoglycoside 6-adenylyltransferase
MEDPALLLGAVVSWAEQDVRVDGVVQTGSRARGQRVDAYSDLDIELICRAPEELAADASWLGEIGDTMVVLALANDEPGGIGWPTRLAVFAQGRKVDFTLAAHSRIREQVEHGLIDLYQRGYVVHLDKVGDLAELPRPTLVPAPATAPTQTEFSAVESEFWFEATQIAVYLARRDLWVVKVREHTMHTRLLQMLEWYAQSGPDGAQFTWHLGHHLHEWLPADLADRALQTFTHTDPDDTLRGLRTAMTLFGKVSATVAARHRLSHRADLPARVAAHSERVLAQGAP